MLEALQALLLAVGAALYVRRSATLAKAGRAPSPWRGWCFAAGLGVVALAAWSPLTASADDRFAVHMVEHLLIGDLAALLLVLGLTGPLLAPLLRTPGLRWLRALGHPAPAVALWALNLAAWHVPVLHEAAVRSPVLHALQHTLFLALGAAMWMPLVGPLPRPAWFGNLARLLYLLGVRLAGAVLANVLLWSGPLYDVYAVPDAAADQVAAASLMMVEGSLLTLVLLGWLFLRAAREGEERQALLDLAGARGVALDEARAARAVAAGRGEELRERIEAGAPAGRGGP